MSPAVATLAQAAQHVTPQDPQLPLYSNYDGALVNTGAAALASLVEQVQRPVRWDLCMESFQRDGIAGMMELAPAGALVGLIKRAVKGTPQVAINSPVDLEAARELVGA
jgi:[acyl-carrier-protein] S-malonyltransferase